MKQSARTMAAAGALACACLEVGGFAAEDVAVEVGPRKVTTAELAARMRSLGNVFPGDWGDRAIDHLRHLVEDVVVPDTLLALASERPGASATSGATYELDRVLSEATVRALRESIGPSASIPDADVRARYDATRARYDSPDRLVIWRILCATEAEAQSALDAARKQGTPRKFSELAREHSLDKGSALRGGDLGFVSPDGTTREPGLRVDLAVVRAAEAVKDGELVPKPVPEGSQFAVVWRRGTVPGAHRTLEQAAPAIREQLEDERLENDVKDLVAQLRQAHLRDFNDAPLDPP